MKNLPPGVRALLLISFLVSATGCTTTDKKAAQKGADDEYVTITVTGSNIPKRVKKSDIAAGKVAKDEQMQIMDKDEFAKSLRPGAPRSN